MARSHTKSGPGRTHGQCRLIADPTTGEHLGVTTPQQRLAPAAYGGNWKGKEYLSARESDMLVRLTRFPGPEQMTRADALKHIKSLRPT